MHQSTVRNLFEPLIEYDLIKSTILAMINSRPQWARSPLCLMSALAIGQLKPICVGLSLSQSAKKSTTWNYRIYLKDAHAPHRADFQRSIRRYAQWSRIGEDVFPVCSAPMSMVADKRNSRFSHFFVVEKLFLSIRRHAHSGISRK